MRVAAAVTLGLAAGSASGCAMSHEVPGPRPDARVAMTPDGGSDAGHAMCSGIFPPTSRACCDEVGGFWDESSGRCSVAVPGPFVPPSLA